MNIATSYATEASFRTRVGEVARHKPVIRNVLRADEIKSIFQGLLLELVTLGSQCRALLRGHFWLLPLTGVRVSCWETASTAKLNALGGGLFLNFNPPGGILGCPW